MATAVANGCTGVMPRLLPTGVGKRLLSGALLLPLILPRFVGGLGRQCIFGYQSALNALLRQVGVLGPAAAIDWFASGFWGVVLLEALHLYPILFLNAAAALYMLAKVAFGRHAYAMASKAGVAARQSRLHGRRGLAVALVFALFVTVGLLPHLGVIGLSLSRSWYRTVLPSGLTLEHFRAALGHNLTVPSILNSVRYAAFAVTLAMLLGVLIAMVVARGKGRLAWMLDSLSMLLGQGQALAAALGVWTMVFLGASLIAASCLLGKRLGARFRV